MSSKYNAQLATNGSGTYKVIVTGIQMDLSIATSEGEAKRRKVVYPQTTVSSMFSLMLEFRSWEHREKFNHWMQTFMERTVDSKGFNAAMTVAVPGRKFRRAAIPEGPLIYGEKIDDVTYMATIKFTGASDPLTIGPSTKGARSYFKPPSVGSGTSKFFFPAGKQLKGVGSLDGAMYDLNPFGSGVLEDISSGTTSEIDLDGVNDEPGTSNNDVDDLGL